MLDDVRPFLTQSQDRYNWTGNVGGGDFFTFRAANGSRDRLGRLRSHYAAQGPTSPTSPTPARPRTAASPPRSAPGSAARTISSARTTTSSTSSTSRSATAAWRSSRSPRTTTPTTTSSRFAYGNADEVIHDGPAAPTGSVGYASASDRGVALNGDAPWVLLRDNQRTDGLREDVACVGFVIRDYRFESAGTTTTTPHVNIVNTNNWNRSTRRWASSSGSLRRGLADRAGRLGPARHDRVPRDARRQGPLPGPARLLRSRRPPSVRPR